MSSIVSFHWTKKYQLTVLSKEGEVRNVEYNPVYHSSITSCNLDQEKTAYTAVVDGRIIHFTPLGKQLMPPPMSEK
jgi:hypothetical protein